jgi:hypothetical protein
MTCVLALLSGHWPRDPGWLVLLAALAPMALIGGCVGVTAGLVVRRAIPAFLVALIASFGGWFLGCAFGLRGSFGAAYEALSALTPNTWAVELIFPVYYGRDVGSPPLSAALLALFVVVLLAVVSLAWARRCGASS